MEPTVTVIPVPSFLDFGAVSVESVLSILILVVFAWWAIFTLVVIYHWARYARDSWMAVPAIAAHLAVSAWIFVFATGGLH